MRTADAPAQEIVGARDDASNAFIVALNLYEATHWIYGDGAFGLRLAAWIARKAPDALVDAMTLVVFRLRQVPDAIRPPEEIAEMAKQARDVCLSSKRHEWHWRNHPSFSKILHPKRIKLALADEIALKQWQRELTAIILEANGRSATGAEDDGEGSANFIAPEPPLRCAGPSRHDLQLEDDDHEWSERTSFWSKQLRVVPRKPGQRRRRREPLTLAGHGVSLKVEAGTLLIRNGFTHYPQIQDTYRFFKGDAGLPSRIIMVDGSGSITFEVLTWLNEQKMPLVKVDWIGNVVAAIGGKGLAANRERIAWQMETRSNKRKRMEFCNALIARKIEGCVRTLEESLRRSPTWDRAMRRARDDLARLPNDPPKTVTELSLLEARSAVAYFRAWHTTSLLWRASSRHPIPDEWRTVGPRYSRVYSYGSRHAAHPVNAILNYAYVVLQSRVQSSSLRMGTTRRWASCTRIETMPPRSCST